MKKAIRDMEPRTIFWEPHSKELHMVIRELGYPTERCIGLSSFSICQYNGELEAEIIGRMLPDGAVEEAE